MEWYRSSSMCERAADLLQRPKQNGWTGRSAEASISEIQGYTEHRGLPATTATGLFIH